MPDLSGIDLCRHIRREKNFYTYIILLTSKADKDQIISGLAPGAEGLPYQAVPSRRVAG
jgi:DNA-binding response OmpR family regulator